MRLYNTLTNAKEDFRPVEEGVVRFYTCGPTVYDYAHIGNFRTFVFQDLLLRYLKYRGYRVIHVMNITDVDDKTIRNARELGLTLKEYTQKFTEAFLQDSKTLRLQLPELMPRATDHIPEMISLIRRLEAKGYTYRRDGSVYFTIARFPEYGKLSKKDFAGIQLGSRVETDEYDKDDARDFVLWKAPKDGEDFWETELGPGRPGWHIECSAMSMKYLGETFDIHCGGVDLIFPHHENEIAQSEGATGKPFVRYWVHPEFLLVEGEKMAKSKGNQFTLRDLGSKEHPPEAIRYLLLSTHYRKQLNFSTEGLRQAQAAIQRLEDFKLRMKERIRQAAPDASPCPEFSAEVESARGQFIEALDDDLNTSAALASVFDFIRTTYQMHEQNALSAGDARAALELLEELDQVFDVMHPQQGILDAEILQRIEQRLAARRRKDFAEADRIRDQLLAQGIHLEDTQQTTLWKRIR
jgi:cysteinyl-tRNA synthetase